MICIHGPYEDCKNLAENLSKRTNIPISNLDIYSAHSHISTYIDKFYLNVLNDYKKKIFINSPWVNSPNAGWSTDFISKSLYPAIPYPINIGVDKLVLERHKKPILIFIAKPHSKLSDILIKDKEYYFKSLSHYYYKKETRLFYDNLFSVESDIKLIIVNQEKIQQVTEQIVLECNYDEENIPHYFCKESCKKWLFLRANNQSKISEYLWLKMHESWSKINHKYNFGITPATLEGIEKISLILSKKNIEIYTDSQLLYRYLQVYETKSYLLEEENNFSFFTPNKINF